MHMSIKGNCDPVSICGMLTSSTASSAVLEAEAVDLLFMAFGGHRNGTAVRPSCQNHGWGKDKTAGEMVVGLFSIVDYSGQNRTLLSKWWFEHCTRLYLYFPIFGYIWNYHHFWEFLLSNQCTGIAEGFVRGFWTMPWSLVRYLYKL